MVQRADAIFSLMAAHALRMCVYTCRRRYRDRVLVCPGRCPDPAHSVRQHAAVLAPYIICVTKKGKGSPYWITERWVPELIPVLGSQPAGDVSHKPGGRLPLLSARPAVTPVTLKRAATNFAAW